MLMLPELTSEDEVQNLNGFKWNFEDCFFAALHTKPELNAGSCTCQFDRMVFPMGIPMVNVAAVHGQLFSSCLIIRHQASFDVFISRLVALKNIERMQ